MQRTGLTRPLELIAIDGVYDLGEVSVIGIPSDREEVERRLRSKSDPELDAGIEGMMASNPTMRWAVHHGMYVLGVDTSRAFCAAYLDYNLRDGTAERIQCPTLVCDAENEMFFKGQAQELYDHLTCPKTFMRFTIEEGAGDNCHPGAQRIMTARVFDWLDIRNRHGHGHGWRSERTRAPETGSIQTAGIAITTVNIAVQYSCAPESPSDAVVFATLRQGPVVAGPPAPCPQPATEARRHSP
ncbi:hypothetical protein [Streptomyces cyaneofuscatus]|uniref:hypothetical protein n=1 Tax=Streptomyces cyaneofuscatus TaxID=66883 RepID=UPI0036653B7C